MRSVVGIIYPLVVQTASGFFADADLGLGTMTTRVLTVEDDPLAAMNRGELEKCGFEVDWVNNGPDGLARAMSGEYDVIMLDRMLPGLDGLTILTTCENGWRTGPGADAERAR